MKKFESLEEAEQNIKKVEEGGVKPEKNSQNGSHIIVITAALTAVIALTVLCVILFKPRKRMTNQSVGTKAYTIEVDGKRYSADSIEELSEMVGFDVSFLINNKKASMNDASGGTDSVPEMKIYELGEMAPVETNQGNYKIGIVEAKLYKRPISNGGDLFYNVSFEVENESVDELNFYVGDLQISDANGNICSMANEYYDEEGVGLNDYTAKGTKTRKEALFHIVDSPTETLQISYPKKGLIFQVVINNLEEMNELYKEKKVKIGEPIYIIDGKKEMEITVDDIRIDNNLASDIEQGMNLLVIDFDVNNKSYDLYNNGAGVSGYDYDRLFQVTDNDNYTLSRSEYLKDNHDGVYSYYDSIKPGTKGRIAIPYLISANVTSITIDFRNGTTLTHKLK